MATRRLHRLLVFVTGLRHRSVTELVAILREPRYPPLLRLAALRALIAEAPSDVTGGAPYRVRRQRVRQHFGV